MAYDHFSLDNIRTTSIKIGRQNLFSLRITPEYSGCIEVYGQAVQVACLDNLAMDYNASLRTVKISPFDSGITTLPVRPEDLSAKKLLINVAHCKQFLVCR